MAAGKSNPLHPLIDMAQDQPDLSGRSPSLRAEVDFAGPPEGDRYRQREGFRLKPHRQGGEGQPPVYPVYNQAAFTGVQGEESRRRPASPEDLASCFGHMPVADEHGSIGVQQACFKNRPDGRSVDDPFAPRCIQVFNIQQREKAGPFPGLGEPVDQFAEDGKQ